MILVLRLYTKFKLFFGKKLQFSELRLPPKIFVHVRRLGITQKKGHSKLYLLPKIKILSWNLGQLYFRKRSWDASLICPV